MQNSGVEAAHLNDEDIGFQLGPRLNAVNTAGPGHSGRGRDLLDEMW